MAAQFAAKINAKLLILNHFSQRWSNIPHIFNSEIAQAKRIFKNIIAVNDFDRVPVDKPLPGSQ